MKLLHDNIYVAGQISLKDIEDAAEAGVTTIINNRPDNEEPGQLGYQEAAQMAEKLGLAYHYLPMVNGQPLPPTLVDDFKSAIDDSHGPVLAHCRSGMRSSFIWALGQISAGNISPDKAIEAGNNAGIPLHNARAVLESVAN